MLNAKDSELLTTILSKDPSQLSQAEIDTLNARRTYLNGEHRRIFASVLKEQPDDIHEEPINTAGQPTQYVEQPAQVQPTTYTGEDMGTPKDVVEEKPVVTDENPYDVNPSEKLDTA